MTVKLKSESFFSISYGVLELWRKTLRGRGRIGLNGIHRLKRFRNGIFVKSNTKRFTEFTNCNLSQRLVKLTLLFSMMLKSVSFPFSSPLTVINRTPKGEIDFSIQSPEFYS